MIVAVQKGLREVKNDLTKLGYEVVQYGEYKHPIDAIVYVGAEGTVSSVAINQKNGVNGVLLVNAANKSIGEIDMILKKRVYTALF